jgi:hypothetical protein
MIDLHELYLCLLSLFGLLHLVLVSLVCLVEHQVLVNVVDKVDLVLLLLRHLDESGFFHLFCFSFFLSFDWSWISCLLLLRCLVMKSRHVPWESTSSLRLVDVAILVTKSWVLTRLDVEVVVS